MTSTADTALELTRAAGLSGIRTQQVTWGLSSELHIVFAGSGPVAIFKRNQGFVTRSRAERSALLHLEAQDFPWSPRLLTDWESSPCAAPGDLLLRWIDGASERGPGPVNDWRQTGAMIAALHGVDATNSNMKFSDDPLPLHERLLHQAERAIRTTGPAIRTRLDRALVELGATAAATLREREFRVVHRDLRPPNIVVDSAGMPLGIVDFEHAAATEAAWDFAKAQTWLCGSKREYQTFLEGYSEIREVPCEEKIRLFRLHEALTLAAYFERRRPEYLADAIRTLDDLGC